MYAWPSSCRPYRGVVADHVAIAVILRRAKPTSSIAACCVARQKTPAWIEYIKLLMLNVFTREQRCSCIQVLKTKHGEDVCIHRFGKPKAPWWSQLTTHTLNSVSPGVGVAALSVNAAVEEFFDAVNTRMLWERHQL